MSAHAGGARRGGALLATAAGLAVAVVCIWFVGDAIADRWSTSRDALANAHLGWLGLAVLAAIAGMVGIALGWWRALRALGASVRALDAAGWFFVGEITKYVPGLIWPVIGRAELARRGGIDRGTAYRSVALSLAALYVAASGIAGALAPVTSADDLTPPIVAALVLAALTGLVAVGLFVRGTRPALALVGSYVPAWIVITTSTWAVARALDAGIGWTAIAVATTVSWLAGFLAVPVPGGVGVREAAFVAATSIDDGLAATVAVVTRLVLVLVDASAALLAGPRVRGRGSAPPDQRTRAAPRG